MLLFLLNDLCKKIGSDIMKLTNFKIVAYLMLSFSCVQATSIIEEKIIDIEQNLPLYLESIIIQAEKMNASSQNGLLPIVKHMRDELQKNELSEILARPEIEAVGKAFYADCWQAYREYQLRIADASLNNDEKNALIYMKLSRVVRNHFPELVIPYPDISFAQLFQDNDHVPTQEYKNIGFFALYCLKQLAQDEKNLSDATQAAI